MNLKIGIIFLLIILSYSNVLATDLAYIVKHNGQTDPNIVSLINELGYSYSVIDDYYIPSDFSNYKTIIIDQGTLQNYTKIPVGNINVLILNNNYIDSWGIAHSNGVYVSNSYSYGKILVYNDITNSLSNPVKLYTAVNIPINYLVGKAAGVQNILGTNDANQYPVIGMVETGGTLLSGKGNSNARIVYFGISETNYWTSDSKTMLKSSLIWLAGEKCTDSDGDYFVKENSDITRCEFVCGPDNNEQCLGNNDCNDNNSQTWLMTNGYNDKDNDGYGSGALTQVCAGDIFPEKYSDVSTDCNDSDPLIFQIFDGYKDSDFDGTGSGSLLQVCSGDNLREGYVNSDQQHNDCNDSNPDVYQLINGYKDSDSDGFGIGNLLEICSGDNLPTGYSDINLPHNDCNDSNKYLYQLLDGYKDSDFDGIGTGSMLQICSGEDLPQGYSDINSPHNDCNDTNPYVYQLLDGYRDSDFDGFGTGNMLQVCSGESLPEGYSDTNLPHNDCNDSDPYVYQLLDGYKDSDMDGIGSGNLLQVCSGEMILEGYVNSQQQHNDCNDNNSSIWSIINAYLDNDKDGYGAGSLKQVCSGDNIPEGYSEISTDCNDSNPDIWRLLNGYLVDSNGNGIGELLQVCSGEELARGYSDQIEESPIINPINKIIVQETEEVRIIVNATDPNNDELTYYINDNRFSQENNVFTWITEYGDMGEHSFIINVSDGVSSATRTVDVEVMHKNQAPQCSEIPEIEWEEDSSSIMDLSQYCTDPDNDSLSYTVYSSTSNSMIWKTINSSLINFTSQKYWSGNEWVVLKVSDGIENISTSIQLKVNDINHEPEFIGNIQNITFMQDTNITNKIDLKEYFKDKDNDNLNFSSSENENITVRINNGLVSFYPKQDYYGTEKIIFYASDPNYTISSNEVTINVLYKNKAPVIGKMDCNTSFPQYTMQSCLINASDFENDSLSYSIIHQNKLNCTIEDGYLKYTSLYYYNGTGSCRLKVNDSYNSVEYELHANVENVNDAPMITSYLPLYDPRIIANNSQAFKITAMDVDSNFIVYWKVDNSTVATNITTYNFTRAKGRYNVSAIVSDGEYNSSVSWDVFVGNTEDFTCSEVKGYICNDDEVCSVQLLKTSNTNNCCPVKCSIKPPTFKAIKKRCDNNTQNIQIYIQDNELKIGSINKPVVKIKNNYVTSMDFKVYSYLYDLSKNKVIDSYSETVNINKGERISFQPEINVLYNIYEHRNYALFVEVVSDNKDKFCNENYTTIRLERELNNVIIQSMDIKQQEVICKDNATIDLVLKNIGSRNQDIKIKLESKALSYISNDQLYIEEYGKDDEINKQYSIYVPGNINPGKYQITATLSYLNETKTAENTISVEKCEKEVKEVKKIETIKLNNINTQGKALESEKFTFPEVIVLIMTIILVIAFIMIYFIGVRVQNRMRLQSRNKK